MRQIETLIIGKISETNGLSYYYQIVKSTKEEQTEMKAVLSHNETQ